MKPHSERWSTVWYVCREYERADEPDRQLLEDMGFKWPTAGLLQTAIWEDMMEHGVDQNTISYNSLLSRWQLASSWQWRTRHSWLRGVTHQRAPPHGRLPERAAPSWICWRSGTRRHSGVAAATDVRMPGGQRPCTSRQVRLQG